MFVHYSKQTQICHQLLLWQIRKKTGAAVLSNNVTFVDCIVSAWKDMSTVMFAHPHKNGLLFLTNPYECLVSQTESLVILNRVPKGWKVRKDNTSRDYGIFVLSDVSCHTKYLPSPPTLLHNYSIQNKKEEWENMSFRKQAWWLLVWPSLAYCYLFWTN